MRTTTQARGGTSQGRSRPGEDYYTGQEREQARAGAGQVRTITQARRGTSQGRSRPGEDYYTGQERNKPGQEQAR